MESTDLAPFRADEDVFNLNLYFHWMKTSPKELLLDFDYFLWM